MIVAGFGFRSGAGFASLEAALAQHGVVAVDALAVPTDKVALLAPLARAMGLPLLAIARDALQSVTTQSHSPASLRAYGVGSVAEAAALAAAGPRALLLHSRRVSPDRMATCAIAQGFAP